MEGAPMISYMQAFILVLGWLVAAFAIGLAIGGSES